MPCYNEPTDFGSNADQPTSSAHSSGVISKHSGYDVIPPKPGELPHQYGTRTHASLARIERAAYSSGEVDGHDDWTILSNRKGEPVIEKSAGGSGRIDSAYVSHTHKKIIVSDLYTGTKGESLAHMRKGWGYRDEPDIKKLTDDGYEFTYASLDWSTFH